MSFKEQLTPGSVSTRVSLEENMYSSDNKEGNTPLAMDQCFAQLADCEILMLTRVDMMDGSKGWRLEFLDYEPHVVEDESLLVVLNEAVRIKELPTL